MPLLASILHLATSAIDGLMSKLDKAKLDAATSSATNSTLVMRDANGYASVSRLGAGTNSPSTAVDVRGTTASDMITTDCGVNLVQVSDPTNAISKALVAGGSNLSVGTYHYGVAYATALGQTHVAISSNSITTDAGNRKVQLSNIPTSADSRVTSRKLYRSKVGEGQYSMWLLATINDNSTTTYLDDIADASLTGGAPQGGGSGYFLPNTTNKFITTNGTRSMVLDSNLTTYGIGAGAAMTAGREVVVGANAALNLTHGADQVIIGMGAAKNATSGLFNTVIGYGVCGDTSAMGAANTIVGRWAALSITGSSNTIMGGLAGSAMTSADQNVLIGTSAAAANSVNLSTGDNNVVVGSNSGGVTSGSRNVVIGDNVWPPSSTASNQLSIGNLIYGTALDSVQSTISSGNIGIGIKAPSGKLDVDQFSTTAAKPTLVVRQADVSEEFVRFIGSAANGVKTQSIVKAADATPTLAGWVKCYVQDDGNQITDQAYYLPIYTLA